MWHVLNCRSVLSLKSIFLLLIGDIWLNLKFSDHSLQIFVTEHLLSKLMLDKVTIINSIKLRENADIPLCYFR